MGYSHDEWTPLIIHGKMAGNRDAQSHAQIIIIKQNSPRAVVGMDGTRCFGLAMSVLVGGWGSINFTILFGNRL